MESSCSSGSCNMYIVTLASLSIPVQSLMMSVHGTLEVTEATIWKGQNYERQVGLKREQMGVRKENKIEQDMEDKM